MPSNRKADIELFWGTEMVRNKQECSIKTALLKIFTIMYGTNGRLILDFIW
jgi:hypothetical protein